MDDTKQEMSLTPRTVLVRTLWEGKEVPCLQVRREGVVISRRGDNNMVNGTKLLEVAGMSRHKSNVILKKEKSREVIATGPAHFKGVWIPYHRALELANTEKITKLLHPLFVPDMGSVTISVGNEDVRTEIARVGSGRYSDGDSSLRTDNRSRDGKSLLERLKHPLEIVADIATLFQRRPKPNITLDADNAPTTCEHVQSPLTPVRPHNPTLLGIPKKAFEPQCSRQTAEDRSTTPSSTDEDSSQSTICSEDELRLFFKEAKKQLLLDRLMTYFYEVLFSHPSQVSPFTEHGTSEQAFPVSSGRNNSISSSANTDSSGNRLIGRKRPADQGDEGDGQEGRSPRQRRSNDIQEERSDKLSRRLACPYFKMNPTRYQTERSCPGPGWTTVHRVKEHLYRCHARPISCPRCHLIFETDREKDEHIAAEVRCEIVRDTVPLDGFDSTQKDRLRCRKNKQKHMTEIEKWNEVYLILFPNTGPTDIPSPYYEYAGTEHDETSPESELARYEQFLRRELPPRVRHELEIRIEEALSPVEESLRTQLVDIVRDMQLQLFDLYRSSRRGGSGGHHRALGASEQTEQAQNHHAPPSTVQQGNASVPQQEIMAYGDINLSTFDEEWELFRPVAPYSDEDFNNFNGELFGVQPSALALESLGSPVDSGYASLQVPSSVSQTKPQED